MVGDGTCDQECFTPECDYDEGDCQLQLCNVGCFPDMIEDGTCDSACQVAECDWDSTDCGCSSGCTLQLLSNDKCDPQCSTIACDFDHHHCVSLTQGDCATACFASMIGNNLCDAECYNEECRWDGLDCECAPGCRFQEIALCKDECLVPDCNYGGIAGYPFCEDEVRRVAAKYYQIQKLMLFKAFYPFAYHQKAICAKFSPWCPEEVWRRSFTECLSSGLCDSESCLMNFGMCIETETCAASVMNNDQSICFECRSPWVNSLGVCREACDPGLAPHPLVSDLCLPHIDASTENNPQVYYISPTSSGNVTDGSFENPFRDISEALSATQSRFTKLLLIGPLHSLVVTHTSNRMTDIFAIQPIPMPRDRLLKITITPYDCEFGECTRPILAIDPERLPVFYVPGPNADFEFCSPAIERGHLELANVVISMESRSYLCRDWSFFLHVNNNDLTVTNVTFVGLGVYEFLIEVGDMSRVRFSNVDFEQVSVCGGILQQSLEKITSCKERYPGFLSGFLYDTGIVEIVGKTAIEPIVSFLYVIYYDSVTITRVRIAGSFIDRRSFVFVYVHIICKLTIQECVFERNNFGYIGAISNFEIYPEGFDPYICLSSTDNILIENSVFRENIYAEGSAISLNFTKLQQNIRIRGLIFENEIAIKTGLIQLQSLNKVAKPQIYGSGYYVSTRSGEKVRKDFPPPYVYLTDISLRNITSTQVGMIFLVNMAHIEISNVRLEGSSSISPTCSPVIDLSACFNVSIRSFEVVKIACEDGPVGLRINLISGGLTLSDSIFVDSSGSAKDGSIIEIRNEELVIFSNVTMENCSNRNSDGIGTIAVSNLRNSFIVLQSIFRFNRGPSAGVFHFSNISYINISQSQFLNNTAEIHHGGALLVTTTELTLTVLRIDNTLFRDNEAMYRGGVAFLEQIPLPSILQISISDSRFDSNGAERGAVFYISPGIEIARGSCIELSEFDGNFAKSEGAISLNYASGTLTIRNSTFKHNIGWKDACIYSFFSITSQNDTPTLECDFLNFSLNSGESMITVSRSMSASEFSWTNLRFESNSGVALNLENSFGSLYFSTFFNNSAKNGPAVTLKQYSRLYISHSEFILNSASNSGGAAYVSEFSEFLCNACHFHNNTAEMHGGAIRVDQDSVLHLFNSTIEDNASNGDGSAIFILMSALLSSAEGCKFLRNRSKDDGCIVIFSANFEMRNSEVRENCNQKTTPGVVVNLSNFTSIGCIFAGQEGLSGEFVYVSTISTVAIVNSSFLDGQSSSSGCIYIEESELAIHGSLFRNATAGYGSAIYAFGNTKVMLASNRFELQNNTEGGMLSLLLSMADIHNCSFVDYANSAISAENAKLTIFGSHFQKNSDDNSFLLFVNRCQFDNNAADESAAIHASSTTLNLTSSSFTHNTAQSRGGALTLLCVVGKCAYFLESNVFNRNSAGVKGGAVCLEDVKPVLKGNVFRNNSAPYGPDISSVAVSLISDNKSITEVPSGQTYAALLDLWLVDVYGQVIAIDNYSKLEITSPPGTSVVAPDCSQVTATQGRFFIPHLVVSARPGSSTTISFSTAAVVSPLQLNVSMRECVVGESEVESRCIVCDAGTYSIDPSRPCQDCPAEAICYGNFTLIPRPGYWRSSNQSTKVFQCPNEEACEGTPDLMGKCALGYEGNMCQTCAEDYVRVSKIYCIKCLSYSSSIIRTSGLSIGIVIFCALIVKASIKSAYKARAIHSIYLKILMNYFQSQLLMGSINMKWPTLTKKLLEAQGVAGGFTEQLFTISCLSDHYKESEQFYLNIVLMAFVPLISILFSSLVLSIKRVFLHSSFTLKDELIGAGVVLFFLVHPCVVRVMFEVFNCEEIDPGKYWVTGLELRCWLGEHWTYAMGVALPSVIVWGIGVPTIVLLLLYRQKSKLDQLSLKVRYGYLFNGYVREKYYWEFVVIYRKLVIISITVFLSGVSDILQGLLAFAIMLFSVILHLKHLPYSRETLNVLEFRSLFVTLVTIFCGLYFKDASMSPTLEYLFFAMIIAVNVYFLQFWIRKVFTVICVSLVKRFRVLRRCFVVINESTLYINRDRVVHSANAGNADRGEMMPLQRKLYIAKLLCQKISGRRVTHTQVEP